MSKQLEKDLALIGRWLDFDDDPGRCETRSIAIESTPGRYGEYAIYLRRTGEQKSILSLYDGGDDDGDPSKAQSFTATIHRAAAATADDCWSRGD